MIHAFHGNSGNRLGDELFISEFTYCATGSFRNLAIQLFSRKVILKGFTTNNSLNRKRTDPKKQVRTLHFCAIAHIETLAIIVQSYLNIYV